MGVEIIVPSPTQLPPIGCLIDNGGITIDPGYKGGNVTVVGDCTIVGWRIIGDAVGSAELDIFRASNLADLPASDSIVGSMPPVISMLKAVDGDDVSDWIVELDHMDILAFAVSSVTGFTQIRIELFRETR